MGEKPPRGHQVRRTAVLASVDLVARTPFGLLSDEPRGLSSVDQIGDERGAATNHKQRVSFPEGGHVSKKQWMPYSLLVA